MRSWKSCTFPTECNPMSRYIEINGVVELPDKVDHDQFWNEFIDFLEDNGYYFGGGTKEIDEEGNPV